MPDFSIEQSLGGLVCGIDEVGRGPLAGPVVAASVIIPPPVRDLEFIYKIQDSKKLSKPKLLEIYLLILEHCVVGVGQCSPAEIDELNILWATMEAMKRAYLDMDAVCDYAMIDGNRVPPEMPCPAQAVVKGDGRSKSIAAASIVAKVTRDRIMVDLAKTYPQYGWDNNAAYPTKAHLAALQEHGVTPQHRRSFRPVRELI